MILEAGDPGQLPTGTVLSLLKSNSAKSDAVLGILSRPAEVAGAARQAIFSPRGVSEAKKGMLARVVVDSVLKTWGVTNKKRNVGVGLYARNVGIDLYARAWRTGSFRTKAFESPHPFERRFHLLCAAIPRWGVCSPLIFGAALPAEMEELLVARLAGTDELSVLVDAALQASVAAAPG